MDTHGQDGGSGSSFRPQGKPPKLLALGPSKLWMSGRAVCNSIHFMTSQKSILHDLVGITPSLEIYCPDVCTPCDKAVAARCLLLLLQAEDVPAMNQEGQAGDKGGSSSGQDDAELPAGVQEGEPRPLKRSRRCSVLLIVTVPMCRTHHDFISGQHVVSLGFLLSPSSSAQCA